MATADASPTAQEALGVAYRAFYKIPDGNNVGDTLVWNGASWVPGVAVALAAPRTAYAKALATTNVDIVAGLPNIVDGVTFVPGDAVHLNGQTVPTENGLYTLTTVVAGKWQMVASSIFQLQTWVVRIGKGTSYKNTAWLRQADGTCTAAPLPTNVKEVPVENYYRAEDGNDWTFAVQRAQSSIGHGGTILLVGSEDYYFSSTIELTLPVRLKGAATLNVNGGTRLHFNGCHGVHVVFPLGGWAALEALSIQYDGSKTEANNYHGVRVEAPIIMRDVTVAYFPGHGVDILADLTIPAGANLNRLFAVRIYECGLSGFYTHGDNANASAIVGVDCTGCGQRSVVGDNHNFFEDSFLGNYYFGCHATGGGTPGHGLNYYCNKPSGSSVFVGCYSEAPSIDFLPAPAITIGGFAGGGAGGVASGLLRNTAALRATDTIYNTDGPNSVQMRCARAGTDEVDTVTTTGDAAGMKQMFWASGALANSLVQAHAGSAALIAQALTMKGAARGRGHTIVPRGVISGTIRHGSGTTPPTVNLDPVTTTGDVWQVGDMFWNTVTTTGTPLYWRCTAVAVDLSLTWASGILQP